MTCLSGGALTPDSWDSALSCSHLGWVCSACHSGGGWGSWVGVGLWGLSQGSGSGNSLLRADPQRRGKACSEGLPCGSCMGELRGSSGRGLAGAVLRSWVTGEQRPRLTWEGPTSAQGHCVGVGLRSETQRLARNNQAGRCFWTIADVTASVTPLTQGSL